MGGMMNGEFGHYFGSFGLMGGLTGLLLNVVIIVGVVLLVVWAVQKFSHSTNHSSATGNSVTGQPLSAREILDIRYAKGELGRKEYQAMLNDIS